MLAARKFADAEAFENLAHGILPIDDDQAQGSRASMKAIMDGTDTRHKWFSRGAEVLPSKNRAE
jgi:hypothetical protein